MFRVIANRTTLAVIMFCFRQLHLDVMMTRLLEEGNTILANRETLGFQVDFSLFFLQIATGGKPKFEIFRKKKKEKKKKKKEKKT